MVVELLVGGILDQPYFPLLYRFLFSLTIEMVKPTEVGSV